MALQSQEVSIAFTEGVDTKTDDKLAAKLSVMENCYIGEKGTPQKRNGFDELSNSLFTSGEQLISNKGVLGLIAPAQFAVKNINETSGWHSDSSRAKSSNINTTFTNINAPVHDLLPGGLQIGVGASDTVIGFNGTSEDTPGSFSYTCGFLRRNSDGSIIRRPVYDSISTTRFDGGCIVSLQNKVWWISKSGALISVLDVSVNALSYSAASISTTANANNYMQAYVENNLIFIIYVNNSGKLVVSSFDSSMTLQSTFTNTTEAETILGGFSVSWNSTRSLYGVFYQTTASTNLYIKSVYLTSSLVISGSIVANVRPIASDSAYYKVTSIYNPITLEIFAAFDNLDTGIVFCNSTPTVLSETFTVGRSSLCSQAFLLNGIPHVAVDKFNVITNTPDSFTFKLGAVSVLMDYRGFFSAQLSSDHLVYPVFCLGKLSGATLPISTGQYGFALVDIKTNNFNNSSPKEILDQSVVFNSGSTGFDGNNYSELGFISFPFGNNITSSGSSGVPAGTYQYALVYKYTDLSGNVYQSAPFISLTDLKITIATAKAIQFTVYSYCPSKKISGVTVEVYRNSLTDVIFKKVGSLLVDTSNAATSLFSDSVTDNSQNETLYTTGGVLENDPSPVANIFWTHQDRVFCVNEENPTQVYFSKTSVPGEGIHFSSFLYISADESPNGIYQRVTGGASLDDKLIIFKNESIYASFGDGSNNLGVGAFSKPRLIVPDIGCRDARSILNTSDGVMFMSNKGMYLLTRSLELVYIGADVEQFKAEEITSAVLLASVNQARFTTRSGVCLAYSYYYKQWSWFTNYESQHAIISNGSFLHLKSTGFVRKENSGFLDISTPIIQRIAIAWLKASGIQNFQRIKRISFVGNYKSTHNVSVKLSYDYENYVWDNVTVTPLSSGYNTIVKPSLNAIYNGANTGTYEYKVQVSRQKCESFKVEISDFNTTGESFSLAGMSLTVGVKKGLNKLSSNKQF